jgi:transcriptional regulator with XRE-family HTH domain
MKEPLGNRVAEARKAKGMTQQQLADAVGSHWITISKLERGRIKLTIDWLEKLARPLGVHPFDLLAQGQVVDTRYGYGVAEPERRFTQLDLPFKPHVVIGNAAYEPLLHVGDELEIKRYTALTAAEKKLAEKRLCLCDPSKDDIRLGFLNFGKRGGTFDLFWLGNRVAEGVKASKIFVVSRILFKLDAG